MAAGTAGKHRFEPSQPLAMGLSAEVSVRILLLRSDSEAAARYLKGETLHVDKDDIRQIKTKAAGEPAAQPEGYVLVCVDGYPVGWGKWYEGILKNELAAGWRVI